MTWGSIRFLEGQRVHYTSSMPQQRAPATTEVGPDWRVSASMQRPSAPGRGHIAARGRGRCAALVMAMSMCSGCPTLVTGDAETSTAGSGTGMDATSGSAASSGARTSETTGNGSAATSTGVDTSSGDSGTCGDGQLDPGEVCDDGTNDGAYGGCLPDCAGLAPFCGDNVIHPMEQCDDGNERPGDGCNPGCLMSGAVEWSSLIDPEADRLYAFALPQVSAAYGLVIGLRQIISNPDFGYSPVLVLLDEDTGVLVERYDVNSRGEGSLNAMREDGGEFLLGGSTLSGNAWLEAVDGPDGVPSTMDPYQVSAVTSVAHAYDGSPIWGGYVNGSSGFVSAFGWTLSGDLPGAPFDIDALLPIADGHALLVTGGYEYYADPPLANVGWSRTYSAEGDLQWETDFDMGVRLRSAAVLDDGSLLLAGVRDANTLDQMGYMAYLAPEGDIQWQHDEMVSAFLDVAVDSVGRGLVVGKPTINNYPPNFVRKFSLEEPPSTYWQVDIEPPESYADARIALGADDQVYVATTLASGAMWCARLSP